MFVTSRSISSIAKEQAQEEIADLYHWSVKILDQGWLVARLVSKLWHLQPQHPGIFLNWSAQSAKLAAVESKRIGNGIAPIAEMYDDADEVEVLNLSDLQRLLEKIQSISHHQLRSELLRELWLHSWNSIVYQPTIAEYLAPLLLQLGVVGTILRPLVSIAVDGKLGDDDLPHLLQAMQEPTIGGDGLCSEQVVLIYRLIKHH